MSRLRDLAFFDIYRKNARIFKDRCAVHWNQKDISYEDLFSQVQKLSAGLAGLGLSSGARIAVLSKNHPVFFDLFGAASVLGLCLVLINRRLSRDEIRHIIKDTTPEILICDQEMAPVAGELMPDFPFLKHRFVIDGPDKTLPDLYPDAPEVSSGRIDMDAPFAIIHTAAVQGKPRGAVLSQANIILANLQIMHHYKLDPSKTHLNILPLFHIMGLNLGLGTLQAGGKNVILEKFDPAKALDLIQAQKVNLIGAFPPVLSSLLEAIDQGSPDLGSLDIAVGLETPETAKRWEAVTKSEFWTMYGQTETSGLITFAPYFKRQGSAGQVSSLADIAIVDDLDTPLPCGETGEITVKGPLVFQGYWNAPSLNEFTFREGRHHTGDLGMLDSDGFLFFKGRKAEKELIKPGGENVFPAEVEKAVLSHKAVKEVCVFGVPDPKFGEGIKAVVALNPGETLTEKDLIEFTGTLIAGYKKPRYVEFTQDFPRLENGGIDRAAVKKAFS